MIDGSSGLHEKEYPVSGHSMVIRRASRDHCKVRTADVAEAGMVKRLMRPSMFQGAITNCAFNGLKGSPKREASKRSISPL